MRLDCAPFLGFLSVGSWVDSRRRNIQRRSIRRRRTCSRGSAMASPSPSEGGGNGAVRHEKEKEREEEEEGLKREVYVSQKKGTEVPVTPTRTLLAVPVTSDGYGPKVSLEDLAGSLTFADDPLWHLLQREAQVGAANEPFLASELYASVLQHKRLEDAVSVVLANKLATGYMQATQWLELLLTAFNSDEEYRRCLRLDLASVMERDPASKHAIGVLLSSKGFHAIECHRLSHWLWTQGREHMANHLQSMISSRFGVDIHPAAKVGGGIFIDHATGVVIGGTAVIGENVSLNQNVTLGGTGKEQGDRHPKIGDGVLIGPGSSVLGNIKIGRGAQINARSLVNKPVEPFTVVSGVPAKKIGEVPPYLGAYPSKLMNHGLVRTTVDSDEKETNGDYDI